MTKIVYVRWEWVKMNSKNEQHFPKWLNIQVCELLQVLTEAAIESCFEK